MKTRLKKFKDNLFLTIYSWTKIPLIGFCFPQIIEANDQKTILKIGLNWRTRNHLKTMYFGALAIGAELSIAMLAVKMIQESGQKIDFLFKDFKINFLKRAEGDVHFICDEAQIVVEQIKQSLTSTERINRTMKGYAIVPSMSPTEKIIEYEITLSVKKR